MKLNMNDIDYKVVALADSAGDTSGSSADTDQRNASGTPEIKDLPTETMYRSEPGYDALHMCWWVAKAADRRPSTDFV